MKSKTKKRIRVAVLAVVLAVILFMPIKKGPYLEGGTVEYCALTYRVIKWHAIDPRDPTGASPLITETEVHVFPFNCRDLSYYLEKKLEKDE